MSRALRREEARLVGIFRRARWLALAAPVAIPVACGASSQPVATGAGGAAASASPEPSPDEGAGGSGTADALGSYAQSAAPVWHDVPGVSSAGEDPKSACAPRRFTPTPEDDCGNYVRLPCGLPAGVKQGTNCFLWLNDCHTLCPKPYFNCRAVNDSCVDGGIVDDAKGGVDIDCSICPGSAGRLPAGLEPMRVARARSPMGQYFAVMATLEAASVHAFRQLQEELTAHGAPAGLVRGARRARRDEVRHARVTGRLARRFGGSPARARVTRLGARPLEVVAIENAVEGCVRETFAALVATFQAANAGDPEIARVMAEIAGDETRHAALSWAVARWSSRRLDGEARARLASSCRAAVESLRRDAGGCEDAELRQRVGLPDAGRRRVLLDALEGELWQQFA